MTDNEHDDDYGSKENGDDNDNGNDNDPITQQC